MNTELNINRGFESMIPKKKKEEVKSLFNHRIEFKLFKRKFSFKINVTSGGN